MAKIKNMTLEQIIEMEKARRVDGGPFGISACKERIQFFVDVEGQSLFYQLEKYVERANKDICFNQTMILACWEMINEK